VSSGATVSDSWVDTNKTAIFQYDGGEINFTLAERAVAAALAGRACASRSDCGRAASLGWH
jgi:hypothetical protein